MSNYPPGVTGNEYAIAGADYEADEWRICLGRGCEFRGDVTVQGYRGELFWTCPECGWEHTEYPEDQWEEPSGLGPNGIDYDR